MDRRYTGQMCECGDAFCAGCDEPNPDTGHHDLAEENRRSLCLICGGDLAGSPSSNSRNHDACEDDLQRASL